MLFCDDGKLKLCQKKLHSFKVSVYRFQRKGTSEILELSLMADTTVRESLVKAKNAGFVLDCPIENVSVLHGSRIVKLSERLSDICPASGDNLFVVYTGISEGYLKLLCELGFSSSDAIEALSKSGNDLVQAITCLIPEDDNVSHAVKSEMDNRDPAGQLKQILSLFTGKSFSQDKRELARYLKMLADQGNILGQLGYGFCLYQGDAIRQDRKEAARYFKMAADKRNPLGELGYGFCLSHGDVVGHDNQEVARYFKMAADKGNSNGQFYYGMHLFRGDGVSQDKRLASYYMKMAADQGHAEAQFNYGVRLFTGDGIRRNKQEAVRYFKMAADQGDLGGQFNYGACLLNGDGVCQDKVKGAYYLKMAADQGDQDGQFNYANCLSKGEGVRQNKQLASHYMKMAADQGHVEAQFNYGICLLNGDGARQDKYEAARYLKMAADQGSSRGQAYYGACLYGGEGVRQDKRKGIHYFKMAATQGDPEGQVMYGLWLFRGADGVRRNDREAARLMKLAADSGLSLAEALYGIFLSHGKCVPWDPEEGVRYFKLASDNGDKLGQYCYAVHLLENSTGYIHEEPQIIDYLLNLRNSVGDASNLYALCTATVSGILDHENFEASLAQSIALGSLCAKFNYATYLLHFFGDDHRRISKAIDHFISVANQGEDDSEGYYSYDSFLKKGLGLNSEARWSFIKAEADAGYCESQFIYGKHLYSLGSREEALGYFKKSAEKKHSDAMFAYAALAIDKFGGKWEDLEGYYKKAALDGVLLAQYNLGIHLTKDTERELQGAVFLQMAAHEILLRREAKPIKISDDESASYPIFMYSPIPEAFGLKATDNYIIEHLSKTLGLLGRMTWGEIMRPKLLTIHH